MDLVAQNVFFFAIALMMVAGAVRVVTTKNIVHAALWLVLVLAGAAGQFILLIAEFTAITQVLVYIGAIVVLFLFGIMLTRAPVGESLEFDRSQIVIGLAVAVPLLALLGYTLWDSYEDEEVDLQVAAAASVQPVEVVPADSDEADDAARSSTLLVITPDELQADSEAALDDVESLDDAARAAAEAELASLELASGEVVVIDPSNTKSVSDSIFRDYLIAFEAISVLLLAALIGAIVLARKD